MSVGITRVDVLIPASIQEGVIVVNVPMNILFYLTGITVLKVNTHVYTRPVCMYTYNMLLKIKVMIVRHFLLSKWHCLIKFCVLMCI